MGVGGYISELQSAKIQDVKLGPVQSNILLDFIYQDYAAWDIYKGFERTNNPKSYKNVNKNIHKLVNSKLIQRIEPKKIRSQRGKIRYKLTTNGIFYILTHSWFRDSSEFISRYKENIIFKSLVFNHFELITIKRIPVDWFHFELSSYLSDCLKMTLDVINQIRIYPKVKGLKILDSESENYLNECKTFFKQKSQNMALNLLEKGSKLSSGSNIDALALRILFADDKFHSLLENTKKGIEVNYKKFKITA